MNLATSALGGGLSSDLKGAVLLLPVVCELTQISVSSVQSFEKISPV